MSNSGKHTAAVNILHKTENQIPCVWPGLPCRKDGWKLALQAKAETLWSGSAGELNLFGDAQSQGSFPHYIGRKW